MFLSLMKGDNLLFLNVTKTAVHVFSTNIHDREVENKLLFPFNSKNKAKAKVSLEFIY